MDKLSVCLPLNSLISSDISTGQTDQDKLLELVLQKLGELPPTMKKLLDLAGKANIITGNQPISLNYNATTNLLSFTVGTAGIKILEFASKAEVVWHKNIVGNTRMLFGDVCGAKKAYAIAERRRNPGYLRAANELADAIAKIQDLLKVLSRARIGSNNEFTTSSTMKLSLSCNDYSEGGSKAKKCKLMTDLNFLMNSASLSSLLPTDTLGADIISLLKGNFIVSLGPKCNSNGCSYSASGLGFDAYFLPSAGKEDMHLAFNNVRIYTPPTVTTNEDVIVTAVANNGRSYQHSLSLLSGSSSRSHINYSRITELANSDFCGAKANSCDAISGDMDRTCKETAAALMFAKCCGICKVFEDNSSPATIAESISPDQYVSYHHATCF